jgi:hypothetical protein
VTASTDEQALLDFLARSGGQWLAADCAVADVELLRRHDHHVVHARGRAGLLLTYHLWSDPPPTPTRIYVLFRHVEGHPRAPADVQRLIERLL